MQAVILAGGQGMRLRPYTAMLPKPLMPIGDRAILEIILHQLRAAGVTEVVIAVGYLGAMIQTYLDHIGMSDLVKIRYHYEREPLGTAGAVGIITDLEPPFIVMNGDILTTLDYAAMVKAHREADADLTVGVTYKEVQIELGVLDIEASRVVGYHEKPKKRYPASMGIYVYGARAHRRIAPNVYYDAPSLVLDLVGDGARVLAHDPETFWLDMGNRLDYERAEQIYTEDPKKFLPSMATAAS
jgi:NDP-sugar pyrophosphorylase family protein